MSKATKDRVEFEDALTGAWGVINTLNSIADDIEKQRISDKGIMEHIELGELLRATAIHCDYYFSKAFAIFCESQLGKVDS